MVAAVPLAIAVFLLASAWPALVEVGVGFAGARWDPPRSLYGIAPMAAATVVSSGLAVAIAAPIAVAYGLHVNLFAPRWLAEAARTAVALLAGTPSVVVGLVGLTVLVPAIRAVAPPGLSLVAATLVLVVMVLPTAAVATDAAIRQVEPDAVAAVRALGLGQWDAVVAVVWPRCANGVRAGLVLAAGRAVGETMAVLMVAGNTIAWPSHPFAPIRTLTGHVGVEMGYAMGVHRAALFATGLALMGLIGLLVAASPSRSRTS